MPKGIPDKWLNYSATGMQVYSTQFLPFKCPLKDSLCMKVPSSERFTPSCLVERFPKIGLVIDLTNTFRYYDPSEFQRHSIQYVKIKCEGHGVVPSENSTKQFFDAVDDYLAKQDEADKLIGVHCTHGLNRTGFLICKYMIERLGFSPSNAVLEFEKARGHKIERKMYINALHPVYPVTMAEVPQRVLHRSHFPAWSHMPSSSYSRTECLETVRFNQHFVGKPHRFYQRHHMPYEINRGYFQYDDDDDPYQSRRPNYLRRYN